MIHGIGQVESLPTHVSRSNTSLNRANETYCNSNHNQNVTQNETCIDNKNCRFAMTKASAFSGECGAYKTYAEVYPIELALDLSISPSNRHLIHLSTTPTDFGGTTSEDQGSLHYTRQPQGTSGYKVPRIELVLARHKFSH